MLQHPVLFPTPPAIGRDSDTDEIVINRGGRTEIRFTRDARVDPLRLYWQVTIIHRRKIRAVTTSIGRLPHAIFHAIQACMAIGLLQPPPRIQRMWCGRKFWYIRHGSFVETQLSCSCGPTCHRHRPLLTVHTSAGGQLTAACLGKVFVTHDAYALAQFVAEQLIARRYLR